MIDPTMSELQHDAAELARQVLQDFAKPEHLTEFEDSRAPLNQPLWKALTEAGLLGVWAGEDVGGAGGGVLELCAVLVEQGRLVVHAPLLAAGVGGLYLDRQVPQLRTELMPGIIAGSTIVVPALSEIGPDLPLRPKTRATISADNEVRVSGTKISVPHGTVATHYLVGAQLPDGVAGVVLVAADAAGVDVTAARTTDRSIAAHVELTEAPGIVVGDAAALAWLFQHIVVASCAVQVGVMDALTRAAAQYTSNRIQFGRSLTHFQTVLKRGADSFIDMRAVQATMWFAAWSLDSGANDADAATSVSTAKWWASEAGHRTAHSMLYIHGGIGNDLTYPAHRYLLWAKQIDADLGTPGQHLDVIGDILAE